MSQKQKMIGLFVKRFFKLSCMIFIFFMTSRIFCSVQRNTSAQQAQEACCRHRILRKEERDKAVAEKQEFLRQVFNLSASFSNPLTGILCNLTISDRNRMIEEILRTSNEGSSAHQRPANQEELNQQFELHADPLLMKALARG